MNERFGTDFNQADQLFFDQIVAAAMADEGLRQAAAVNPGDKFELVFKSLLENLFVERMDQNEKTLAVPVPSRRMQLAHPEIGEGRGRKAGKGAAWAPKISTGIVTLTVSRQQQ